MQGIRFKRVEDESCRRTSSVPSPSACSIPQSSLLQSVSMMLQRGGGGNYSLLGSSASTSSATSSSWSLAEVHRTTTVKGKGLQHPGLLIASLRSDLQLRTAAGSGAGSDPLQSAVSGNEGADAAYKNMEQESITRKTTAVGLTSSRRPLLLLPKKQLAKQSLVKGNSNQQQTADDHQVADQMSDDAQLQTAHSSLQMSSERARAGSLDDSYSSSLLGDILSDDDKGDYDDDFLIIPKPEKEDGSSSEEENFCRHQRAAEDMTKSTHHVGQMLSEVIRYYGWDRSKTSSTIKAIVSVLMLYGDKYPQEAAIFLVNIMEAALLAKSDVCHLFGILYRDGVSAVCRTLMVWHCAQDILPPIFDYEKYWINKNDDCFHHPMLMMRSTTASQDRINKLVK